LFWLEWNAISHNTPWCKILSLLCTDTTSAWQHDSHPQRVREREKERSVLVASHVRKLEQHLLESFVCKTTMWIKDLHLCRTQIVVIYITCLLSCYNVPIFVGLAYRGKYIVFRFIIEYSSLRDFGPYVIIIIIIGLFLFYEDFWKMIFWLALKLEISYNRVIIFWRILVCFRGFFEDHIFAWWIIWVSMILLLL
jgi:hypothetical protein